MPTKPTPSKSSATPTIQDKVEALCQQVYLATRGSAPKSLELAREAVALARGSGDAALVGLATRNLGHAWRAAAAYLKALSAYAASDRAYVAAGLPVEKARNAIGKLDAFMYLGRYDEALQEAQQAQRVFQEAGEELRLATLNVNLGSLYYRMDRYSDAARAYEESLEIFKSRGMEETLANVRLNLAIVKSSLLQFDQALKLYETASNYYHEAGLVVPEALSDYNIACLEHLRGHFCSALTNLDRARAVLADSGDAGLLASCQLEEAQVFLSLDMPKQAGHWAKEAASNFSRLGMRYEHGQAQSARGVALALQGLHPKATAALAEALRLFRAEGNDYWVQLCRLHIAEVHQNSGRSKLAISLASTALKELQTLNKPRAIALANLVIGSTAKKKGRTALGRAVRGFRQAGAAALEAEAMARMARDLHREGQDTGARRALLHAIRRTETLRARLSGGSLRRQFQSSKADLYCRVALLALKAAEPVGTILHWLERGRARTLVELLDDRDFQGSSTGGNEHSPGAPEQQGLRDKLNLLYRQLDSREWAEQPAHESDQSQKDRLLEQIDALERRLALEEIRQALDPGTASRESFPKQKFGRKSGVTPVYGKPMGKGAKVANSGRRTAPDVSGTQHEGKRGGSENGAPREEHYPQAGPNTGNSVLRLVENLGPDTLSIEYFEVDGTMGAVALRQRSHAIFWPLCKASEAARLSGLLELEIKAETARAFHRTASTVAGSGETASGKEELRRLADLLLAPIFRKLGLPKQLLILPTGVLSYIPFAALDYEGKPIMTGATCSTAPSFAAYDRFLSLGRQRSPRKSGNALLVGYGPNLPRVEAEIAAIEKRLPIPSVRLSGPEATLSAFRTQATDAPLLHLACHGVFRRDHPLFSSLLLADGRLSFHDIFQMRLTADLVVLSACETGRNEESPGEEIIGLAGGFLQAGARAVIMTLGKVLDSSSEDFTANLYEALRNGERIDEALARAMRVTSQKLRHPAHWAPYVLVGDPTVRLMNR